MSNNPPVNLTGSVAYQQATLNWDVNSVVTTIFNSSGTYARDIVATSLDITAIGGGAGGGAGQPFTGGGTPGGGGGGQGGGFANIIGVSALSVSASVAITVGVGGVGGGPITYPGTDGDNSSFGTYVNAHGGRGGLGWTGSGGGGTNDGMASVNTLIGTVITETGGVGGVQTNSHTAAGPGASCSYAGGGGGSGFDVGGSHISGAGGSSSAGVASGGAGGATIQFPAPPGPQTGGGGGAGQTATGIFGGAGGGGGGGGLTNDGSTGTGGAGGTGGGYGGAGGGGGYGQSFNNFGGSTAPGVSGEGGAGNAGVVSIVAHYPPPDYYNIYRGGVLIGQPAAMNFVDLNMPLGAVTYGVSAVYGIIESSQVFITLNQSGVVYGAFADAAVFAPIVISDVKGIKPRIYVPIQSTTVSTKQ